MTPLTSKQKADARAASAKAAEKRTWHRAHRHLSAQAAKGRVGAAANAKRTGATATPATPARGPPRFIRREGGAVRGYMRGMGGGRAAGRGRRPVPARGGWRAGGKARGGRAR